MAVMEYPAQHFIALLGRANGVRLSMAEVKRELKTMDVREACLHVARILATQPERVAPMRVHEFLELVPRMGDVAVRKMLQRQQPPIWPLKRVRELTTRQRLKLSAEIRALVDRCDNEGAA